MKRNKLLAMLCAIVLIAGVILAGCAGGETPVTPSQQEEEEEEEQEVYQISLAVIGPEMGSSMNRVVHLGWLNYLEEASGGRIETTFYPACQAAAPDRFYDEAVAGTVDIGNQLLAFVPGRFPGMEVAMLPMLFEYPGSHQAGQTMMALYEKYPEIQAEFSDTKVLYWHAPGINHIHNNVRPIETLEDLDGLIINGSGKYLTPALTALGATPESLGAGGETYDGLAKGVIDGTSIEWEGLGAWGYIDVLNYSTEVGLVMGTPFVSVMNMDTWNSLPPDLQALFDSEHMWDVTHAHGYTFDENDIHWRGIVEERYQSLGLPDIYVLPDDERARWIDAVAPIRQMWIDSVNDLGYPGQKILDDAIMFAEQYKYTGAYEEAVDIIDTWWGDEPWVLYDTDIQGAEGH